MQAPSPIPSAFKFTGITGQLLFALTCVMALMAGCKSAQTTSDYVNEKAGAEKRASATSTNAGQRLPILFLAGDSTVHNSARGLKGWGDVLSPYFDESKIKVENRARGGRSSRTFQTQGWWDQILAAAQPGDFVIVQLGHNDSGEINDTNRARGTIRGLGDESQEIYNLLTRTQEVVHTYGWYMRKYITDARAKGMTPIICSPVPRLPKETVTRNTVDTNSYITMSREVAASQNASFIDLNHLILMRYVGMTPAEIKTNYFTPQDNTHFSQVGAGLNAACVVEGVRGLTNCPLKEFLLEKPAAVAFP
jgi:rhamnogalacturonan acetylesterase